MLGDQARADAVFDATFLELEEADDSAVMHIGGALLFAPLPGGGTPAIGKVREHLERRLDLLPRYRQKLGGPRTGGLSWPSWEADQRFEIEAHVRHGTLPSPGEGGEFREWISDFYSHRLDRSRPLWEIVLADGRWALVYVTHHCLVDGVGSVGLVARRGARAARRLYATLCARVGLRRRLARMALISIRACRPPDRRGPRGRSRHRARGDASPGGFGALARHDQSARP